MFLFAANFLSPDSLPTWLSLRSYSIFKTAPQASLQYRCILVLLLAHVGHVHGTFTAAGGHFGYVFCCEEQWKSQMDALVRLYVSIVSAFSRLE